MKNRIPRKLKKRCKKMGIWKAYLSAEKYFLSDESFYIRKKAFTDLVLFGKTLVPTQEDIDWARGIISSRINNEPK